MTDRLKFVNFVAIRNTCKSHINQAATQHNALVIVFECVVPASYDLFEFKVENLFGNFVKAMFHIEQP